MKTREIARRIVIFLLIAAFLCVPAFASTGVPKEVMHSAEAVVRIVSEYRNGWGRGTGFVVVSDRESTLVVTNNHVIDGDPMSISIYLGEEQTISAKVLAKSEQKDLAVLQLSTPITIYVPEIVEEDIAQGEAVYAVGFPAAADYLSETMAKSYEEATITNGIVSAVRQLKLEQHGSLTTLVQTNAAINPGNSGGPMFNSKGQVVGVNTYSANDSQGVFGAVAASELRAFLATNHIELSSPRNAGVPAVVWIVLGTVILAVLIIFLLLRRKKRGGNQTVPTKKGSPVSLREYMAAFPEGLGANRATALLMPIAVQLRDRHNNGSLHLQVSPETVFVSNGVASLSDPASGESSRYVSGFAAPEVYTGAGIGTASDVYSLCAVLDYVATGKVPENALARQGQEPEFPESLDEGFQEILRRGFAPAAGDRFTSVQELIGILTPYNMIPAAVEATVQKTPEYNVPFVEAERATAPARKVRWPLITAGVLVLLAGLYFGSYGMAGHYAAQGEFGKADKWLILPAPEQKLNQYIEAGKLFEARDYDASNKAFLELPGYRNADMYANESVYRFAAQHADASDFDYAIGLYKNLAEIEYKDAEELIYETKYRKGLYLLHTEKDYNGAYSAFLELSRKNYPDADERIKETYYYWALDSFENDDYISAYQKMGKAIGFEDAKDLHNKLAELVYVEGQAYYQSKNYTQARKHFDLLKNYAQSSSYLTLISAHGGATSTAMYNSLIKLIGFEDANELLLSNHAFARQFLVGSWRTSSGTQKLKVEKDSFHMTDDLPRPITGSGYWHITDSVKYTYKNKDQSDAQPDKYIEIIDYYTIQVYCYKDRSTYKLYRK